MQSYIQAKNLKKCTKISNVSINVRIHRTLINCHGVILESDLQYISEAELLDNLKDQKVVEVKRIYIHKNNEKIATKLPLSLKSG